MSYLNPTRIHFAGQFRADVSTVNNDFNHYDNATFVPADQLPQTPTAYNGWWQPAGTGAWRIDGCRVTAAFVDGKPAPRDPVVGLEIRDTGSRVSAKLVDLDPDQQMVSTIFGLEVRIIDPASRKVLMRADFEPAPFYDIWFSRGSASGDSGASAFFQSVLTGIEWGDIGSSPALTALQAASQAGTLSIKFMADSYGMSLPNRGFGRMVGTIGPQLAGEPKHFVPGRYLAPLQPQTAFGNVPVPIAKVSSPIGYVGCWVDVAGRKVIADFGNALMTGNCGLLDVGPLHLLILDQVDQNDQKVLDLGRLEGYSAPGWYEKTAGIQAFPLQRPMTDEELAAVATNPLCIATTMSNPPLFNPLAIEPADGIYARPDLFVYRMEPESRQDVPVMALQFGKPLADAQITTSVFSLSVQSQDGSAPPSGALTVADPDGIATDANGWATVTLATTDPGWPRDFIDGDVFGVNIGVTGAVNAGTPFSQWCFISVLAFSKIEVTGDVTWAKDVQPILQQYSNLYPRPHGPDRYVPYAGQPPLHPVVNLSNEQEVTGFATMIKYALGLPITHPNHMPVTRDLSDGRRAILLDWLAQLKVAQPAAAAPPPLPTAPAQAPGRNFAATRECVAGLAGSEPVEETLGGKTVAMRRMGRILTAAAAKREVK